MLKPTNFNCVTELPVDPSIAAVEDFLDRVCSPLLDSLDYHERHAIKAELRHHLMAIAVAHQELGTPADVAMEAAIDQLGDPHSIGVGLLREQKANHLTRWLRMPMVRNALIAATSGSTVFFGVDILTQSFGLTAKVCPAADLVMGFAAGIAPTVYLVRHSSISQVTAAKWIARYYCCLVSGIFLVADIGSGWRFRHAELMLLLVAICSAGAIGAVGGAVLARSVGKSQALPSSRAIGK